MTRQFETGVREASIDAGDLLSALKCLGLNTMEQEIMDLSNNLSRDGLIFFPDFCSIVLKRYREEDEEEFAKTMFKVFCGTDPLPTGFRAKKYKVYQKYLTKADFQVIFCLNFANEYKLSCPGYNEESSCSAGGVCHR